MHLYSSTSQEVLNRISRRCPESLSTYLQCIDRADDAGQVIFTRALVEIEMADDMRMFRSHLKKLAREDLIEWHLIDDSVSVKLAAS